MYIKVTSHTACTLLDVSQELLSLVLSGKMAWDQLSSQSELFTALFTLVTSRDTRRCYYCPVYVLARITQNLAAKNCCTSSWQWHSYEFIVKKI
jgi:hypothetical protein